LEQLYALEVFMKRASSFAILLLLLCAAGASAADRLRIAYSSISAAYTGIWVAQDAAFLPKKDWTARSFSSAAPRNLLKSW
jgi:hypothetical protein